ncbi:MBL fold metallo-hydrolase [Aureimonas leprariae]|uniref:MBL fold metallo-hydrolase n=2 Tax=Plantimonas leprariae TaxID=2615207 RepID=A0A7V7PKK7_9HYPH|nr:MBL fold metallo-hydrolase [Aureimonas leprariae]
MGGTIGRGSGGIHRRAAMKLAGGLGVLAAGAPYFARQAEVQAAETGMQERPEPKWRRFKVGDAVVTIVLDGLRPGDGPYPTFGADQSEAAVAELMRANFLPEKRFVNGFLPVFVETGGQLVLFDTGMGPMGRANGMGRLRERMGEAGYKPEDVTLLVLTHLHGDHIGGAMEEGGPAFPNAKLALGRAEYGWWTSDEAKNGERKDGAALVAKNVTPLVDKARFLRQGDEVLPGIVAHEAFGHTQGHMIFEMTFGGRKLWHLADTSNHYVASLQRPDWRVRFDHVPEQATATRKRVFGMVAEKREPFVGYHMPFPGIGFAEQTGEGFRFVPVTYQFDV